MDTLTENAAEGNDTLDFSAVTVPLTFNIGSAIVGDGGLPPNTVTHTPGNVENLMGGVANDAFIFADGVTLAGGTGTIDGGGGTANTLDYSLYTTNVTVNLMSGLATGTAGVTRIQNITGGSGNDTLIGDNAVNVIIGNDGDDTITGNGGNDALSGGLGNDTFIFANGWGIDTLVDAGGTDTLDFGTATATLNFRHGSQMNPNTFTTL